MEPFKIFSFTGGTEDCRSCLPCFSGCLLLYVLYKLCTISEMPLKESLFPYDISNNVNITDCLSECYNDITCEQKCIRSHEYCRIGFIIYFNLL